MEFLVSMGTMTEVGIVEEVGDERKGQGNISIVLLLTLNIYVLGLLMEKWGITKWEKN